MRKLTLHPLILAMLAASSIHCSSKPAQVTSENPPSSWSDRMNGMAQTVQELYPYLSDDLTFQKPENRDAIEKRVKNLQSFAHDLNSPKVQNLIASADADPSVAYLSRSLANDLNKAVEAFEEGRSGYSRVILKASVATCVQCHSRGKTGPEFEGWLASAQFAKLKPWDQAELLTAFRRYDDALAKYDEILRRTPTLGETFLSYEYWARRALKLAVQAKQDPKRALEITNNVMNNKQGATFLHNDTRAWKAAIERWQKEKPSKNKLQQAKSWIAEGERKREYWEDDSGLVHFLRASALLHEALRDKLALSDQAEAFYLLGEAYDAIERDRFSNLANTYWRACIHVQPKSTISAKCFSRYEENVHMDFMGSGVVGLPAQLLKELRELRETAI